MRKRAWTVTVLCAAVVLAGCVRSAEMAHPVAVTEPERFAAALAQRVGTDAMMAHLHALQDIANAHGNTRAVGTPGYEASVDYVSKALRDKGFDVQTPEFTVRISHSEPGTLTAGPGSFTARALTYSVGTPSAGVTAPLVVARAGDDSPGCVPADYDGLPVAGAVILVDRGKCTFTDKMTAAASRGALAVVIADNVDEKQLGGTLGEKTEVKIPVVGISKADGAALRGHTGPVTLTLDAGVKDVTARNVVAQTKTGSAADVVMAGAHLDSVPEGPGINDNGSGVAAVLEMALQLGPTPQVRNAIRFGFWGAEELGLVGSHRYVESLNLEELRNIALYLNFDMLASPNPGYFTYDGDQSGPVSRDTAPSRVPEGSAGIERTLVAYLKSAGKTAQDTAFDGRSDYDGFTLAGIPSGGLFAGAEENMNEEQAKLWGGRAHEPFDPNYHKATDTIDAIDRTALGIQGAGVAYVTGLYAAGIDGRNAVPVRDDRTRHVVKPS
ncbi:MAG TPA: M28 family metallopeptidase [Mycobacterium sp.]|nr:M28 family metallopeptidase [Mycobacterium sp.]